MKCFRAETQRTQRTIFLTSGIWLALLCVLFFLSARSASLRDTSAAFYGLTQRAQLEAVFYERIMTQVTKAYENREAGLLKDRQWEFCMGYWWGFRALAEQLDMGVTNKVTEELDSQIVHSGWKQCNPGQPDLTYP